MGVLRIPYDSRHNGEKTFQRGSKLLENAEYLNKHASPCSKVDLNQSAILRFLYFCKVALFVIYILQFNMQPCGMKSLFLLAMVLAIGQALRVPDWADVGKQAAIRPR
jgi:hypothetical protein